MYLLTQAWLVLDCCISHDHFGAFKQFPLEDLLLDTEICCASTMVSLLLNVQLWV